MINVLTSLENQFYRPDDIIVEFMQSVEELIIIHKGYCNVYGYQFNPEDEKEFYKIKILKLP